MKFPTFRASLLVLLLAVISTIALLLSSSPSFAQENAAQDHSQHDTIKNDNNNHDDEVFNFAKHGQELLALQTPSFDKLLKSLSLQVSVFFHPIRRDIPLLDVRFGLSGDADFELQLYIDKINTGFSQIEYFKSLAEGNHDPQVDSDERQRLQQLYGLEAIQFAITLNRMKETLDKTLSVIVDAQQRMSEEVQRDAERFQFVTDDLGHRAADELVDVAPIEFFLREKEFRNQKTPLSSLIIADKKFLQKAKNQDEFQFLQLTYVSVSVPSSSSPTELPGFYNTAKEENKMDYLAKFERVGTAFWTDVPIALKERFLEWIQSDERISNDDDSFQQKNDEQQHDEHVQFSDDEEEEKYYFASKEEPRDQDKNYDDDYAVDDEDDDQDYYDENRINPATRDFKSSKGKEKQQQHSSSFQSNTKQQQDIASNSAANIELVIKSLPQFEPESSLQPTFTSQSSSEEAAKSRNEEMQARANQKMIESKEVEMRKKIDQEMLLKQEMAINEIIIAEREKFHKKSQGIISPIICQQLFDFPQKRENLPLEEIVRAASRTPFEIFTHQSAMNFSTLNGDKINHDHHISSLVTLKNLTNRNREDHILFCGEEFEWYLQLLEAELFLPLSSSSTTTTKINSSSFLPSTFSTKQVQILENVASNALSTPINDNVTSPTKTIYDLVSGIRASVLLYSSQSQKNNKNKEDGTRSGRPLLQFRDALIWQMKTLSLHRKLERFINTNRTISSIDEGDFSSSSNFDFSLQRLQVSQEKMSDHVEYFAKSLIAGSSSSSFPSSPPPNSYLSSTPSHLHHWIDSAADFLGKITGKTKLFAVQPRVDFYVKVLKAASNQDDIDGGDGGGQIATSLLHGFKEEEIVSEKQQGSEQTKIVNEKIKRRLRSAQKAIQQHRLNEDDYGNNDDDDADDRDANSFLSTLARDFANHRNARRNRRNNNNHLGTDDHGAADENQNNNNNNAKRRRRRQSSSDKTNSNKARPKFFASSTSSSTFTQSARKNALRSIQAAHKNQRNIILQYPSLPYSDVPRVNVRNSVTKDVLPHLMEIADTRYFMPYESLISIGKILYQIGNKNIINRTSNNNNFLSMMFTEEVSSSLERVREDLHEFVQTWRDEKNMLNNNQNNSDVVSSESRKAHEAEELSSIFVLASLQCFSEAKTLRTASFGNENNKNKIPLTASEAIFNIGVIFEKFPKLARVFAESSKSKPQPKQQHKSLCLNVRQLKHLMRNFANVLGNLTQDDDNTNNDMTKEHHASFRYFYFAARGNHPAATFNVAKIILSNSQNTKNNRIPQSFSSSLEHWNFLFSSGSQTTKSDKQSTMLIDLNKIGFILLRRAAKLGNQFAKKELLTLELYPMPKKQNVYVEDEVDNIATYKEYFGNFNNHNHDDDDLQYHKHLAHLLFDSLRLKKQNSDRMAMTRDSHLKASSTSSFSQSSFINPSRDKHEKGTRQSVGKIGKHHDEQENFESTRKQNGRSRRSFAFLAFDVLSSSSSNSMSLSLDSLSEYATIAIHRFVLPLNWKGSPAALTFLRTESKYGTFEKKKTNRKFENTELKQTEKASEDDDATTTTKNDEINKIEKFESKFNSIFTQVHQQLQNQDQQREDEELAKLGSLYKIFVFYPKNILFSLTSFASSIFVTLLDFALTVFFSDDFKNDYSNPYNYLMSLMAGDDSTSDNNSFSSSSTFFVKTGERLLSDVQYLDQHLLGSPVQLLFKSGAKPTTYWGEGSRRFPPRRWDALNLRAQGDNEVDNLISSQSPSALKSSDEASFTLPFTKTLNPDLNSVFMKSTRMIFKRPHRLSKTNNVRSSHRYNNEVLASYSPPDLVSADENFFGSVESEGGAIDNFPHPDLFSLPGSFAEKWIADEEEQSSSTTSHKYLGHLFDLLFFSSSSSLLPKSDISEFQSDLRLLAVLDVTRISTTFVRLQQTDKTSTLAVGYLNQVLQFVSSNQKDDSQNDSSDENNEQNQQHRHLVSDYFDSSSSEIAKSAEQIFDHAGFGFEITSMFRDGLSVKDTTSTSASSTLSRSSFVTSSTFYYRPLEKMFPLLTAISTPLIFQANGVRRQMAQSASKTSKKNNKDENDFSSNELMLSMARKFGNLLICGGFGQTKSLRVVSDSTCLIKLAEIFAPPKETNSTQRADDDFRRNETALKISALFHAVSNVLIESKDPCIVDGIVNNHHHNNDEFICSSIKSLPFVQNILSSSSASSFRYFFEKLWRFKQQQNQKTGVQHAISDQDPSSSPSDDNDESRNSFRFFTDSSNSLLSATDVDAFRLYVADNFFTAAFVLTEEQFYATRAHIQPFDVWQEVPRSLLAATIGKREKNRNSFRKLLLRFNKKEKMEKKDGEKMPYFLTEMKKGKQKRVDMKKKKAEPAQQKKENFVQNEQELKENFPTSGEATLQADASEFDKFTEDQRTQQQVEMVEKIIAEQMEHSGYYDYDPERRQNRLENIEQEQKKRRNNKILNQENYQEMNSEKIDDILKMLDEGVKKKEQEQDSNFETRDASNSVLSLDDNNEEEDDDEEEMKRLLEMPNHNEQPQQQEQEGEARPQKENMEERDDGLDDDFEDENDDDVGPENDNGDNNGGLFSYMSPLLSWSAASNQASLEKTRNETIKRAIRSLTSVSFPHLYILVGRMLSHRHRQFDSPRHGTQSFASFMRWIKFVKTFSSESSDKNNNSYSMMLSRSLGKVLPLMMAAREENEINVQTQDANEIIKTLAWRMQKGAKFIFQQHHRRRTHRQIVIMPSHYSREILQLFIQERFFGVSDGGLRDPRHDDNYQELQYGQLVAALIAERLAVGNDHDSKDKNENEIGRVEDLYRVDASYSFAIKILETRQEIFNNN